MVVFSFQSTSSYAISSCGQTSWGSPTPAFSMSRLALVDRGQPDALGRLQGCVTDLVLTDKQVLKVLPGVELKSLCRRPLPIRVKLVL